MHVVLWETRQADVKAHARPARPAEGLADRLAHFLVGRCRRPAPLLMARLAAVFKKLGHTVEHAVDRFPRRADLVVFVPTLAHFAAQRRAIERLGGRRARPRLLAVGPVAGAVPELLQDLEVIVVKGEAEQLFWKLDAVLDQPGAVVQLGMLEDLDSAPFPEWAPFSPWLFRLPREFWQFPTARIEASRGEPGIERGDTSGPGSVRYRSAESVVKEICEGIGRWGFYSFQFCDLEFGRNRGQVFQLAEQIGRMNQSVQFSIRSRADLLRPEMIRVLRRVGLTCIRLAIDISGRSASETGIVGENEALVASCRRLGIRTIAEFCVAPAERAAETAGQAWQAARRINATFAEFRACLPPADSHRPAIAAETADNPPGSPLASIPVTASDVFLECLEQHRRLYYARRVYWRENLRLLLPALGWLEDLRRRSAGPPAEGGCSVPPRPLGRQKRPARQSAAAEPSPRESPPDGDVRAARAQPGVDDRHPWSA